MGARMGVHMTDRQKQRTDDIVSRIIDEMPGGPAQDDARKALEKLPGVCIKGDIAQMAITLSGPINFAPPARAARRP